MPKPGSWWCRTFCRGCCPPAPPPVVTGGPEIVVFNAAQTPLGFDLSAFVPALQEYVDAHLAPVWGTPARLRLGIGPEPGAWPFGFWDTADAVGALAYHDFTVDGLPLAKTFVKTIRDYGASVTVAASHELAEILVDPAINLVYAPVFDRALPVTAGESADPVEADRCGFKVQGFLMSDFIYPAWFEDFHKAGSVPFDHTGYCTRPFQILPDGYAIVLEGGEWKQIFGSREKAATFAREDRRGHRSEARLRRVA